ncbi:DNA mismatch repair protein [Linnemannia exigua]|uniref:DNA mismatch repair protein n=1 Tax=Linnemannia exigua TaxID=604196 RepID=A0AAD4DGR8_9FUNG|nr:DNA mismatch repair protein [Linnemannia exigua]
MASIQPLASSVSDELRASLVVNSLQQCTAELIQNTYKSLTTATEYHLLTWRALENGTPPPNAPVSRTSTASRRMGFAEKFPVRQRYWSDASGSKLEVELERVKRVVETLALVVPGISFTIIDLTKDTKIMSCRKVDSQLHRITATLGQALSTSMSFVKSPRDLDPVFSLSGYISTQGHYNRLYQYIFLNQRPVQCENLQRLVTHLFQQSSFAADSLAYAQQDARRSRERHPIFVLMLTCPTSEYDLCADPSKVNIQFEDEEKAFHVNEIDLEDELEFELDADWMATMLDNVIATYGGNWVETVYIWYIRNMGAGCSSKMGQSSPSNCTHSGSLSAVSTTGSSSHTGLDAESLQLSKAGLRRAKVISQLDCKFILCMMEDFSPAATTTQNGQHSLHGSGNKVLVVIDQHAADERVRVERLMKEMCTCSTPIFESRPLRDDYETTVITHRIDSMSMIPPLPITLTRREWHMAEQSADWLSRWGIVLEESSPQSDFASRGDESEGDLETVMVSQHFTQCDGVDDAGSTVSGADQSAAREGRVRTRAGSLFPHGVDSDCRQGHVVSLPRIVADRCVVDGALTQDLIKDALSSFEEGRYRSRKVYPSDEQGTL